MTFYIWQEPDGNGTQRITEVYLRGGNAEISGYRDLDLENLITDLIYRPSLPILTEYQDAAKRRHVERVNVLPGESNFEFALIQAIQREGGYLVSFTPPGFKRSE